MVCGHEESAETVLVWYGEGLIEGVYYMTRGLWESVEPGLL